MNSRALRQMASADDADASALPNWDLRADVIVVGYGGSGAVAAATAHDRGAATLVLEKQAEAQHTSNTQLSLGAILCPQSAEAAIALMNISGRVNVERAETMDVSNDVIAAWARYAADNRRWLTHMGAARFTPMADPGRKTGWPGLEAMQVLHLAEADGEAVHGHRLFAFFDGLVRARGIAVHWGTAAVGLIQNEGGEVVGVRAESGGRAIAVEAKRAVILTCGGFEHDEAALRT
jgi:succinate dehydrogenase/fumarate reductase flavoprotein subunit